MKTAPNGRICGFCEICFKCSINYFLEYNDLTRVVAATSLLLRSRGSLNNNFQLFCAIQNCYSQYSLNLTERSFLLKQAVQIVQKNYFQKYSEKNFRQDKDSSPKSKQYFRKKMFAMGFVLFSVMSWASSVSSVFSNFAQLLLLSKQHSIA